MRVWTGKLRLLGEATRANTRRPGPEVDVRITVTKVAGEDAVAVEVSREHDAFGQPRWQPSTPSQLSPESLCLALVADGGSTINPGG